MQVRIDTRQLLALLVISRITISLLVNPGLTDPATGQDTWLILLVTSPLIAFGSLGPTLWLLHRSPGEAMPQILERLLGRWPARLLLLWQAIFVLLMLGIDLREVGDFLALSFLPPAAIMVPVLMVTALGTWAALAGVEVIGRFSQITFPLLLLVVMLMFLLVSPEIEWRAFLPLKLQVVGPLPAIRQTIISTVRWEEVLWLGLVASHLSGPQGLTRTVAYASFWLGLLWSSLSVMTTGLLGPLQTDLFYPYLTMTRLVKVPGLVERLDALVLVVWLFCCTVRFGIMLWANARLLGTIVRVRDRPLILPQIGIILALAFGSAPSVEQLRHLTRPSIWIPMALTATLLPSLLALPFAFIRGRRERGDAGSLTAGTHEG